MVQVTVSTWAGVYYLKFEDGVASEDVLRFLRRSMVCSDGFLVQTNAKGKPIRNLTPDSTEKMFGSFSFVDFMGVGNHRFLPDEDTEGKEEEDDDDDGYDEQGPAQRKKKQGLLGEFLKLFGCKPKEAGRLPTAAPLLGDDANSDYGTVIRCSDS